MAPLTDNASDRSTRRPFVRHPGQPGDDSASRRGGTADEAQAKAGRRSQAGPEQADGSDHRETLRDRAREFFGQRTRARAEEQERLRQIDLDRAANDSDGMDPREQLLKLRSETRLAGEAYMQSLRDSNLLVPGFNDDERETRFNAMHHVYMQMMVQAAMKPLSKGVNTHSVVQAVGMFTAMTLLSKDFRREVGNQFEPVREKIQERMDNRTRSMLAAARIGDGAGVDRLSRKWRNRVEELQHRERGHRDMFTPASAALTEVALMENAFWRMREPGADGKQVHDSYRAMRVRLHAQMADDGLHRVDVVHRARVIIGERMEHEPELRTMFNGAAHGRIVRPPAAEDTVWNGEFDDQLGHRLPDDGMFTVRRTMDADEHQVQLAETMRKAMLGAIDNGDPESYRAGVFGYMVGCAARREGLDTRGLPPAIQQRLDQSEVMLASMDIDGLSPAEQQRVYSNAYVDAMNEVARVHPQIGVLMAQELGPDWMDQLQHAVDDPRAWYAQQRLRAAQGSSGPSPGAGPTPGPEHSGQESDQQPPGTDDHQPG